MLLYQATTYVPGETRLLYLGTAVRSYNTTLQHQAFARGLTASTHNPG